MRFRVEPRDVPPEYRSPALLFFDLGHFLQEALKGFAPFDAGLLLHLRQHLLDRLWLGRVGLDISLVNTMKRGDGRFFCRGDEAERCAFE
jgi:hypothetical protein